jgi:hypothetical protein
VVLAILAVSASGCGTVCNFGAAVVPPREDPEGWPRVYGGLQLDAMVFENASGTHLGSLGSGGGSNGAGKALLLAAILVAPVAEAVATLVGDTLTLPITLPLDMHRHPEKYQKPKEQPVEVIYDGPPQFSVGARGGGDAPLPSEPCADKAGPR